MGSVANFGMGILVRVEVDGPVEIFVFALHLTIAGKKDTWRNTEAGDKVSGAKDPRLSGKTADKAVSEFVDRVREVNRDDRFQVRVIKAIAFGGYTYPKARSPVIYVDRRLGRLADDRNAE